MFVHQLRNFKLGSHAVGGGNQNGVFGLGGVKAEQTAKTADAGQHFLAGRRFNQGLMRSTKALAVSMSTPDSLYVEGFDFTDLFGIALHETPVYFSSDR